MSLKPAQYIYPKKMLPLWFGIVSALILLIVYEVTQFWPYALLLAFSFIYSLTIYFILSKWHLELFDDKIVIQTPIESKTFLWENVSVTFITGKLSYNFGYYYWYFQDSSQYRFGFDVNLFTRNQLKEIAQRVLEKCPENNIDIKIVEISKGKFPFYIL